MKIIQRSDGKFFATYTTRTKFGDWMAQNLFRTGMTLREVAEKTTYQSSIYFRAFEWAS